MCKHHLRPPRLHTRGRRVIPNHRNPSIPRYLRSPSIDLHRRRNILQLSQRMRFSRGLRETTPHNPNEECSEQRKSSIVHNVLSKKIEKVKTVRSHSKGGGKCCAYLHHSLPKSYTRRQSNSRVEYHSLRTRSCHRLTRPKPGGGACWRRSSVSGSNRQTSMGICSGGDTYKGSCAAAEAGGVFGCGLWRDTQRTWGLEQHRAGISTLL
ncbi:hypothetical protein SAICODRAFT_109666 [Saitoella complicata NRRL Y-17804]|uniref:uncharacterized protein n=1 Tax=Saitoella complicata (strain BCRC 22490 / CBS 7301 / JCM 7358 / NBRC 10748 / NRRL Y-17804) TaxID=698492 RepID=UPI0008681AF7|nr:uncharacterized protein SAICODRAFT_109666 [Saitoella complicata NRRL Y-17804]ODQ56498.1 hypothetical protein SAICODRAFT_109666 [Saitoella complicata NRRL Y-17804]